MHLSSQEYRQWKNKSITLLGMSGVGKTYLANKLRQHNWFHYSADYRIGTRYLDELILDLTKEQAMQVPFLRELLRKDWIYIRNNIKIDDLGPVMAFIGMLGNPEKKGIELSEFIHRQAKFRQAEINAMYDVPMFMKKAQSIYNYSHFINDVGGSICELDKPEVIDFIAQHTLFLYIKVTTNKDEEKLIERAVKTPKPLYYHPHFLHNQLTQYLTDNHLHYAAEIDPHHFARWIFPRLFHSRIPKYEAMASQYGYTVTADEVSQVNNENDFNNLIELAIDRS